MPKGGKKGQPAAATAGDSIDLAEAPGPFHFGDVVHVIFSAVDPTNVVGQLAVQVSTGGLAANVANSGDPVTLGPTPSWSGPDNGTLRLMLLRWVDQGPGVDAAGFETVLEGPTYEVIV